MIARALTAARALSLCALLAIAGCSQHAAGTLPSDDARAGASRLLGPSSDGGSPSEWAGRAASSFERQGQGASLYPLVIGNQWDYVITTRTTIVTDQGPQPPVVIEQPWVAAITGTRELGLRTYFIQTESDPRVAAPSSMFLMRDDRSGLYLADAVGPDSPAARAGPSTSALLRESVGQLLADRAQHPSFERAADAIAARLDIMRAGAALQTRPGGADPGETTQLRYPLHMGARWIVRDSPRFVRTAVGRERLELPAGAFTAWKLRGTSELYGPRDRAHFWYARAGLVRLAFHAEGDATDDAGNVIGRMIVEQDQVLESLHLHQPGDPFAVTH